MPTTEKPFDLTLLANAVEAAQTSFIVTDHSAPDNPIIYCNSAFERLTGYTREEIIGKNCRFLQAGDKDQPHLQALRKAITEGKDCNVLLRNYRKDGKAFYNELSISPVYAASGTVTHLIGIQREALLDAKAVAEQFRHEWRTPVTIVKSTLQLLKQKGLSADPALLTNSLDAALRAIERLQKLAERMPGDPGS